MHVRFIVLNIFVRYTVVLCLMEISLPSFYKCSSAISFSMWSGTHLHCIYTTFTLPYCMYIVSCLCLAQALLESVYYSFLVHYFLQRYRTSRLIFFTVSTLIPSFVPPANKSIENICSKSETFVIEAVGTVSKRTLLNKLQDVHNML